MVTSWRAPVELLAGLVLILALSRPALAAGVVLSEWKIFLHTNAAAVGQQTMCLSAPRRQLSTAEQAHDVRRACALPALPVVNEMPICSRFLNLRRLSRCLLGGQQVGLFGRSMHS